MKYDLELILKYWRKHKRQAMSFLIIFIILLSYLFISFSMVRTEQRRIYFEAFYTDVGRSGYTGDGDGNYNFILYNVQNNDIPQLDRNDIVSEYESVFTIGYIGTDNYNYTAGAYPNERSTKMGGFKLADGNMPNQSGEIAISELALENMGITAKVGDNLSLNTYNFDREKTGEVNVVISGIFKDNGTNEHWDTDDKSINDIFEPVIILPIEDINCEDSQHHIMMKLVDGDKIGSWSEERNNEFLDFLVECFDASNCTTYGMGAYDSSYFTYGSQTEKNSDEYMKLEKSYFYQYVGYGAAVLMTITLFCGLFVMIPERIKSFRLLWQVGCPIGRIRRIFLIEWIIFTVVGLAFGLVISIVGYEILLQIQYAAFGLDIYRAYKCEWGIQKITYSPIIFSMVTACIASFAAYFIPFIRIGKLVVKAEHKTKTKGAFSPKKLSGYVHKIFGSFKIAALQMISLVLVLALSCTAYMFFSVNGKDSYSNPQILEKGKYYITDYNLDRRKLAIDCTIENTHTDFQPGMLDLNMTSGYTYENQSVLTKSGLFSTCYAWSDIIMFAAYPHTADVPKALKKHNEFAEGEQEWYGLTDKNVFDIDFSILVNDEMLKDIISGADYDENSIFIVSSRTSPFAKGDIIPFFSASAVRDPDAQFGYSIESKCQFEAVVADVINLNALKNNDLLSAILDEISFDYIIVVPYNTAKAVSLPRQNFEQFYMRYNENTTDEAVKSLVRTFNLPESSMAITTINDCNNDYYKSMMKECVIVFTVFGLLLLLSIIGYAQTIKLQIAQRERQLGIMHSLGMSDKSVKISLFKEMMMSPILAGIVSALSIYILRLFLYQRYMFCEKILEKLYVISNNTSDEAIRLSNQYAVQSRIFMTRYEMWKVPIWGLWTTLFILILGCIGILVWSITTHRLTNNLNKTEE